MAVGSVSAQVAANALVPNHTSPEEAQAQLEAREAMRKSHASAPASPVKNRDVDLNFFDNFTKRQQARQELNYNDMKSRADSIRERGAILKKHPMPDLVKEYLGEVRDFLDDIRQNAYEGNFDDDGIFQKLDVVDDKLDQLAAEIIDTEKEGFEIADSLGQLEGLLIDIFV